LTGFGNPALEIFNALICSIKYRLARPLPHLLFNKKLWHPFDLEKKLQKNVEQVSTWQL
jgi:hypothetical protein